MGDLNFFDMCCGDMCCVQVSNGVVSIVDLWGVSSAAGELIVGVDLVSVVSYIDRVPTGA